MSHGGLITAVFPLNSLLHKAALQRFDGTNLLATILAKMIRLLAAINDQRNPRDGKEAKASGDDSNPCRGGGVRSCRCSNIGLVAVGAHGQVDWTACALEVGTGTLGSIGISVASIGVLIHNHSHGMSRPDGKALDIGRSVVGRSRLSRH